MSRRVLALLSLAALAACSDQYPSAPGAGASLQQPLGFVLHMSAGDSLDLTALAAERLGAIDVTSCSSTAPTVATLLDAERLVAVANGASVIRCAGAFDRRLDTSIDEPLDETDWTWITFDVQLYVGPTEIEPAIIEL